MKYILLYTCNDFENDRVNINFKITENIQDVFDHLKCWPDNKAYKLNGEILPMEEIAKKKV
jgi:hypothetical protein